MEDIHGKIGKFWSKKNSEYQKTSGLKMRWWQSPQIIRHINWRVCGENVSGASQGLINVVKKKYISKLPFAKAISVGCGTGQKEMNLIKQGIVEHFDLYELSLDRINAGKKLAEQWNLTKKVNFIQGDAFDLAQKNSYDLVHWNNALHHMFDVRGAVSWSRDVLHPGGLFFMDDFIGAARFQWSNKQLEIASRIRLIFRDTPFINDPRNPGKTLATKVARPNPEKLAADDPSEAVESHIILAAIREFFPDAFIKNTGGVVYHLVLNDMLANFEDNPQDEVLLQLLLLVDDLCCELGETHYAVALGTKEINNF